MSENQTLIFAAGNPMLDMAAHLGKECMDRYDLPYGGAVLAEEKHQPLFQEIQKHQTLHQTPGGSAINTIRNANHMLKSKYPGACMYFGSIGQDKIGEHVKKGVQQEGLKALWCEHEDLPTSKCAVVVHEGERALCCDIGAACKYKLSHLQDNIKELDTAQILYTTGFFINSNFEAVKTIAKFAHDNDRTFAINLSAVWVIDFHFEQLKEIISYADYVFGNEDETSAFGKKQGLQVTNLSEVTEYIAKLPKKNESKPRTVVTTQGSRPVLTAIYDHTSEQIETDSFQVEVIDKENICDMNGAGDAFVGGFLAQLLLEQPLSKCVHAGLYLSGECITRSGTYFPRPCKY